MRVSPLAPALGFVARVMLAAMGLGFVDAAEAGGSVTRVDPSFHNDAAEGQTVMGIARRPDGRIWAGGMFTRLGGGAVTNLAVLEADGSLSPGFVSSVNPGFQINHLIVEADGGCLVAGGPVPSAGTGAGGKAFFRVDAAGKIDDQFPGWTQSSEAALHLLRIDGDQVLLTTTGTGTYSADPVALRGLVMKFSGDGIRDESFAHELEFVGPTLAEPTESVEGQYAPPLVLAAVQLTGGDLLLGGWFQSADGIDSVGLVRISPGGGVKSDWRSPLVGSARFNKVYALERLEDGSVLVAGVFQVDGSNDPVCLLRLRPDLSLDTGFHVARFGPVLLQDLGYSQRAGTGMARLTDGRIALGGWFVTVDDYWREGLCVFSSDGQVDRTVETGFGLGRANSGLPPIMRILPVSDDSLLIAGSHRGFDMRENPLLMRLVLGTDGPLARLTMGRGLSGFGVDEESRPTPYLRAFFPPDQIALVQESTNFSDWRTVFTNTFAPAHLLVSLIGESDDPSGTWAESIPRPNTNVFYRLVLQPRQPD